MEEKTQFDTFLGGGQELPAEVHILKLASARANEIAAMTYSIDNPQQTKLAFQKLPTHMRRRVMSHNAKRMPRRLREVHNSQMAKSGLAPPSKRPSRKYRRRADNLLQEYQRRQGGKHWLETHVWHAKRFRMIERWNYKIPYRSNNRCFRASYRAVARHCLLQDVSYYSCVQISGRMENLRPGLLRHCDPGRLTFAAKCYLSGSRERALTFFKRDSFPSGPIGRVQFAWQPGTGGHRTLWIWVHPSFYNEFLSEIRDSFQFGAPGPREDGVPASSNAEGCEMLLLRGMLNRFRMSGPLSLAVLTDALRLPEPRGLVSIERSEGRVEKASGSAMEVEIVRTNEDGDVASGTPGVVGPSGSKTAPWNEEYYADPENLAAFRAQSELFDCLKSLESPNQLPPGMVMGFTVLDPRYSVPKKRTKSVTNDQDLVTIPVPPSLCSLSPVWRMDIRRAVSKSCAKSSEIDRLRSENLVPGVENDSLFDQKKVSKVPILVIQRPGSNEDKNRYLGFGSGIDLILPSGWALPFWLSLIMRCARPGGLRESRSVILENSDVNSPDFAAPDTRSGCEEAKRTKELLVEKYFRFPPNRRVNFVKLGISSPFRCEWELLAKEWSGVDGPVSVLRDKHLLRSLGAAISGSKSTFEEEIFRRLGNYLVPVKVSLKNRGCPRDFALITIPTEEDLASSKGDADWRGPVEGLRKDRNEWRRRKLRLEHAKVLRRLRKGRSRDREAATTPEMVGEVARVVRARGIEASRRAVEAQRERMRSLYLPECSGVRLECDRETAGYVVQGDFSFGEARGIGIGYVMMGSLLALIGRKNDLVLIRNTKTRQYRFARIEVIG